MNKNKYLTGEDLGLKPSTIEKAKFEYSPLGNIFNKGLSEEDKKEGLLKKLKNIEDKNEMQLKTIKDQGEKQMTEIKDINRNNKLKVIDKIGRKSANANKILRDIKKINNKLESAELVCIKTDGTKYDFNIFMLPLRFAEKIHNYEITLDEAINNQTELSMLINKLNNYNPRIPEKVNEKNNVLNSARELWDVRKDIISFWKRNFSI